MGTEHHGMETAEARFDRFFEAFEAPLRSYCARRLDHESVDDVVNECFAIAWRKIDVAPVGDAALPWLYGVAYREIQHAWRGAGRRARLNARVKAVATRSGDAIDERFIEEDDRRRVLDAAANLDEADQEVLRLTLWEELPAAEAAAALGVTADAARQRASRARKRLAAEFHRLDARPSEWARPTDDQRKSTPS